MAVGIEVLRTFRDALRGSVLLPDDPGYDDARRIWNGMFDRRPAMIARCLDAADVITAVRLARDHGLLLSIKGGGHNIAGLAVCEGGLVIDLSLMKSVSVDPVERTARAEAGCTIGDLDRATQPHGLAAVMGIVSATGIAGLTTGGGFGYLTRRHGWACDNVRSMEVVTADGELVHASDAENQELFWCLRGGGGNFGIVTSFEYQLHSVGPEVIAGGVAWRGEDARDVLDFYRAFTATAPRELTCLAFLRMAPPAPWLPSEVHGKFMVLIFACYTGSLEDGDAVVAPLKSFGRPVADFLERRPYTQLQTMWDATQPVGRRYGHKSGYLSRLEPPLLDAMVTHAKRVASPHSAVVLTHLGGALNELPRDHSPVGNRDATFIVTASSAWDSAADDDVNLAWTRDCWQALVPFSTGGAYLNFLTEEEGGDRVTAAYGKANFDRLVALKRKYDPQNLFRHTKHLVPV